MKLFFCCDMHILPKTKGEDRWGDSKEEKETRKQRKAAKKQAEREERLKQRDPKATRLEVGDRELFKFRPKKSQDNWGDENNRNHDKNKERGSKIVRP